VEKEFIITSLENINTVANQLVPELENKHVCALFGPMGVGKTTLISALCAQMGIESEVNSPTFAIVNEYFKPNGDSVFHFDFYRINSLNEAFDFGYEEYFYSNSLCLVEWPEKIEPLLPDDTIYLILSENADGSRKVLLTDNKLQVPGN
jgi:tRNA threonylcarbamoyladenosine biosynthesis protein TsaE